jgi:predicted RNase H-like HicB family nuclease
VPRWPTRPGTAAGRFGAQYWTLVGRAGARVLVFCRVGRYVEFYGPQRLLAERTFGLVVRFYPATGGGRVVLGGVLCHTARVKLRYIVTIERETDGRFIASVPEVPGCHVYGRTRRQAVARAHRALQFYVDEAIANIREVIGACLETRIEQGLSVPV